MDSFFFCVAGCQFCFIKPHLVKTIKIYYFNEKPPALLIYCVIYNEILIVLLKSYTEFDDRYN